MNCREFETEIDYLARERALNESALGDAVSHLKDCAACAHRLADERALAEGLRSLAASDALREAPASAEAALREAFRKQSSASIAPAAHEKQGLPFRLRWVAAAAAAAALMIFALSASRMEQPPSNDIQASDHKPAPPEKKEKSPPEPENKPEQKAPPKKKRLVLLQAQLNSKKPVKKKAEPDARGSTGTGDEIATRFLPLAPAGSLDQMDGGQLVRVEMPRSALVSFGLPMNVERANERIKADVLIGNDGVARAIRFVR
jgi:hypothetical protein